MKRCLLLFIFWLSVLGGSLLGSTRGEEYEDIRGRIDLLTGHDEDALAAVVHANSIADISLQQSMSVHISSLLRRYPQFRASGERFFVFSVTEAQRMASRYQVACGNSGNYHALLKQSGYYLYQLCRLII